MNAFTGQTFQMNQIINLKEVMRITGLSRATIYPNSRKTSGFSPRI